MRKKTMITVVALLFLVTGLGVLAFAHGPAGGGNGSYGAYGGWHCPWMGSGYTTPQTARPGVWHCPWANSGYTAPRGGWYCPWMNPGGAYPQAPGRPGGWNQTPPAPALPR